jgi:hypothetical protein
MHAFDPSQGTAHPTLPQRFSRLLSQGPQGIKRLFGVLGWLPMLVICQGGPLGPGQGMSAFSAPPELFVSPQGSDHAPGTRVDAPLRSLDAAASRAGAGTTVHLLPGTYHSPLITRRGGSAEAPMVFKGHPGAILDGSKLPGKNGSNQNQGLVELRHPHVRLEGLVITQAPNTGILLAASHLTVNACEISYTQRHAISTETRHQPRGDSPVLQAITLTGNAIHHSVLKGAGYGQAISLIADGFVIARNRVYENRTEGIDLWLGASHGEVRENEVYRNGAPGIYVDGGTYIRIHRNHVYGNAKGGIGLSSEDPRYRTHDIWVYNNLVYDHPSGPGCFVWDPDVGVERALFAHNTLVNNKTSFDFAGRGNSVEVTNNLGHALSGTDTADWSVGSRIDIHHNTWLDSLRVFLDASKKDFRLTRMAPGIDGGNALPELRDDRGNVFVIDTDYANQKRPLGKAPDLGAYETR